MQTMRIQLKGWSAVGVVVLVLGFVVYRYFALRATLPDELRRELTVWLQAEYSSQALRELQGIDVRNISASTVDPRIQRVLDASEVEITSVSARGNNPGRRGSTPLPSPNPARFPSGIEVCPTALTGRTRTPHPGQRRPDDHRLGAQGVFLWDFPRFLCYLP